MKISMHVQTLLSFLALTSSVTADVPANHPSIAVLTKFSPHFRCPYADEWISKGPKQAALDLGLWKNATSSGNQESSSRHSHHHQSSLRRRAQGDAVAGSCVYKNNWSGQEDCLEMRGELWTAISMQDRCGSETDGTLTPGSPCAVPPALAGWCLVGSEGSVEATPLAMADTMGCAQMRSTCEAFMAGTFEAAGGCASEASGIMQTEEGDSQNFPYTAPTGDGANTCAIAPGAVGAGHQAAYSSGYSPVCEGTPAEGSPYMWPMAWAANVESKSMSFGSDDVIYQSVGKVHYRLDKNWKRQDWWYQRGVQRSIGQSPCPPEDRVVELSEGPVLACRRDSDELTTMIHRGSKMMFISWKNDTQAGSSDPAQIAECNWLDLQIVGNIRPDWYMDDRGDSTDVQYLGNQHVFYENEPRLVKQWRKKDFANQYFVMSMLANPKDDGVHWPMILNVPGEGFGDDFLQSYANQTLLSDDDDELFLLDEALEAIGGACQKMDMEGGAGPPTGQTVHIPSNLEVDPNSWFSSLYTYSPVWEPPISDDSQSSATGETGMATTESGNVVVKSCYDASEGAVQLSVEFTDIEMLDGDQFPWMALGYRETEECLMNPRGGGDTEMILLSMSPAADSLEAHFGVLPVAARSFDDTAVTSIYGSLTPLAEKDGYSDVHMHVPTTTSITKSEGEIESVALHFKQGMETTPEVMHLMYAIGSSTQVGYHRSRRCFEITEFPSCPTSLEKPASSTEEESTTTTEASPQTSSGGRSSVVIAIVVGAISAAVF